MKGLDNGNGACIYVCISSNIIVSFKERCGEFASHIQTNELILYKLMSLYVFTQYEYVYLISECEMGTPK